MQSPSQCLGSVRPDKLSRLKLRSEPKSLRLSVSDRLSHLGLFGSAVALTHSLRRVFPPSRFARQPRPRRTLYGVRSLTAIRILEQLVRMHLGFVAQTNSRFIQISNRKRRFGDRRFLFKAVAFRPLSAPFPLRDFVADPLTPHLCTPTTLRFALCVLGGGILNFRGIRGGI
ncbi:hypothetical protein CSUIS_a0002 (plasmid) [Campylobacter porcelli]|uniref:Uncharacterized protein n=1 Tax=Campylobacter porcelli TaxID=1660073 RepID=A0A1X9SYT5_9BACT|nr:hypothetical protein CSUIS_a0002 [Campylobacter sp. RM6137]